MKKLIFGLFTILFCFSTFSLEKKKENSKSVDAPKVNTSKAKRSTANSTSDSDLVTPALINFLSCKDSRLQQDQLRCLSLTSTTKNRRSLAQWLLLPYLIQEIRRCSIKEAQELSRGFQEQTEIFVCFKALNGNEVVEGIAFFEKEAGAIKLHSLFEVLD